MFPESQKTDIVFCTVPYTETTLPLMAPAVLKSIATRANKKSVTLDLNLELIKYLESASNRYELLEFFHSGEVPKQVQEEIYNIHLNFVDLICSYNPSIVGLSVFTYNCQASTKLLCVILKKINPDIKIIVGGAGIGNNLLDKSKFGESLVKQNLIDFYIKGDGENSLYEYLTTQSSELSGINSDQWTNLSNEDLAQLPIPDYSDYNFDAYDTLENAGHRVVPILGSRGCVRNCSFCDIHNHWNKFTWRAGEHVFEEMLELNKKYQSTFFLFQDSLINGNQKEYKKMCLLLQEYNQDKSAEDKFKWGGYFILRPKNQFKEEDWKLTADAGANYLAIGIETLNDEARFHLGKKFTNDDIEFGLEMIQKYNIPVGLGDLAESRMVQAGRSILKDTPITGGMAATAQEAKQEAFNRAVGQTFGANAPKLTLDVIDDAKKTLGNKFDEIWNNNNLVVAPNMLQTIENVKKQAQKLPKNEAGAVLREIDDLYSKIVPDASGNSIIPGDVANKFQSYLRRRAESFPALSDEFTKLRRSIIDTFNDSVKPEDAAALTLNRSQYKAFKTVEPLIRNAELGIAGREAGDIPAALLPQAVNRSYGDLRNVPLAELSKLGSRVLVDRTPQTGGSMRALMQLGALGGSAMAGLPGLAVGATTAVGIQELLRNPRLANAVIRPGSGAPNQLLIDLLRAGQLSAPVIAAQ